MGRSIVQKVYVVDDDEAMRKGLDSLLRSVGYEVELFASGTQFLAYAEAGLAGCILLDVRLPGPSGLEIQRRLGESGNRTPIVFVTGYGDISMAVQAMKANAVEFLTKPFRDQDLLDAISQAMERDAACRQEQAEKDNARRLVDNLSPREHEIFVQLCLGRLGKQIAHDLQLSEATVKVHRRNIMQKLGVVSVSQMILLYGHFATEGLLDYGAGVGV